MRIAVIGAGYVGHVVSACFASLDHTVTVYDIDEDKIDALRQGTTTIHEPGLDDLVATAITNDALKPTTQLETALNEADTVFLCVGTPPSEDGSVNLDHHYSAVNDINPLIDDQDIVIKSTVPPGTAAKTAARLGHDAVYNNPEFLREGNAVEDFLHPDRVVIGGADQQRAKRLAHALYSEVLDDASLYVTDNESAELIKYAANAFLATKISYANELARLCDHVGADIDDVTGGMAMDHRIQDAFFGAGAGYGGSCFPKDTEALINHAERHGEDMHIVSAAQRVNHGQRERIIDALREQLGGLTDQDIAVLGLAFKPGTDDIRQSPALTVVDALHDEAATVHAHDPRATENFKQRFPEATYYDDPASTVSGADAVVLLTGWDHYHTGVLDDAGYNGYVLDTRNHFDPATATATIDQVGKP